MSQARILITGASSGIGAALAAHYAERLGEGAHLGLLARRADRLEELAGGLRAHGARVDLYAADVRDAAATREACLSFAESAGGVSLAIANAGLSLSDKVREGDPEPAGVVIATNVQGVLHTLLPLIPGMIERREGHLAVIGSVAGFRAFPGKGAYCASKAAVKILMDAYRPVLRPHGIRVTTICPGFVESELTDNNPFPMPFMMETPKAARLIARAIARGRKTYVFPWQWRLLLPVIKGFPDWGVPNLGRRK